MKKVLLAMMLVCSTVVASASALLPPGEPIPFTSEKINKDKLGPGSSRGPVQAPVVYLDDYTLLFETHGDFVLQLVSSDDVVVYETCVPSSVSEVQLPSYITGEYELQLLTGSISFIGYIVL